MLSSFSNSLANTRTRNLGFALVTLMGALLYGRSFTGLPVWDDMTFWFFDPKFHKETFGDIWTYSTWPLTLTVQKILYSLFGLTYWPYHVFNFVLHTLNAWLVYSFLRTIRLGRLWSLTGFTLFLLHPASAISVAWMIQFKTLLCFSFGLASLVVFLRRKSKGHLLLAWVLYLLSVLSKSSALPLPLALLFLLDRPIIAKKNLAVIPFFLIAAFGAWKINFSKFALEGVKDALETTGKGIPKSSLQIQEEEAPDATVETSSDEIAYESRDHKKGLVRLTPFQASRRMLIKTLRYYFWQAYLPVDNAPVKGLNPYPPGTWDYLHLAFLAGLVILTARLQLFFLLAPGFIFLLPYLGIIPAPFMNVTWVSDQHLYMALPFFLGLFLCLVDRLRPLLKMSLVLGLALLYSVKLFEASAYYKDNFTFYGTSIERNINNIPLVYNLTVLYLANDRRPEAIELLEYVLTVSKTQGHIRENRYFPYLVGLYSELSAR